MIWICTDPDNFQYRKVKGRVTKKHYFKEFNRWHYPELFKEIQDGTLGYNHKTLIHSTIWSQPEYWITNNYPVINLKQIKEHIEAYGYSLDELSESKDGEALMWECVFEQESYEEHIKDN